jgi:hypothetical protein
MTKPLHYTRDANNDDAFSVTFTKLPALQPQLIKTENKGIFSKILAMGMPREYELYEMWHVTINNFETEEGKIEDLDIYLPSETKIDGASIPIPWVIAFLSLGLLRPMGILFTASIVHDYTYKYGLLPLSSGRVKYIKRHNADKLFKDMIYTINNTPVTAFIAWWGVRLGYLGCKHSFVEYMSAEKHSKSKFVQKKRRVLNGTPPPKWLLITTAAITLGIAITLVIGAIKFVAINMLNGIEHHH